jgi:heat shock protein HslJ
MSRKMILVVATALAVCACGVQAVRDPAAASSPAMPGPHSADVAHLDGTQWRFVEVAGMQVPAAVDATMRLHDGHASGKAGCNAYGAAYRVAADGTAQFTQSLSTRMACLQPPGAMRVERGVFDALQETAKVEIRNGELVLLDAAGNPLAKLARASVP